LVRKALLKPVLLACADRATANAGALKVLHDESDSILTSPSAVQLLVAFSITAKNKELAKSLIASIPAPPPQSHAIFDAIGHGYPNCFTAHPALAHHKDNACDVWLQLLESGWAHADVKMFRWATASIVSADALALATALVDRGLHPDREIAQHALRSGPNDLIPLILDHYKPSTAQDEHELLKAAAVRQPPEEAIAAFELLFSQGISDINWIDKDSHVNHILENWPLGDPRGVCEMSYSWSPEQSVLHAAVMGGHLDTIEWLVGQGAERQYDGWGRDPYNTAKFHDRTDAMELLSKLGMQGKAVLTKVELWDPRRTVDQAQTLRREKLGLGEEKMCVIF
jgi:hypothetical protein